ncbi:MAG: hypothetical protein KDJ37_16605 [Hyphomicrobiaceae bacterium]|nr:hypothetical protein [Hyphomicrobiaceae bacterium]
MDHSDTRGYFRHTNTNVARSARDFAEALGRAKFGFGCGRPMAAASQELTHALTEAIAVPLAEGHAKVEKVRCNKVDDTLTVRRR